MHSNSSMVVAVACLFCVSVSNASGLYGGVGYGATKADVSTKQVETALGTFESSTFGASLGMSETWSSGVTDDSDSGLRLFAGLQITPNLSVEAGYADLGSFSARASLTVPGTGTDTVTGTADVKVLDVSALGHIPVGNGSFGGRLGLARWDVDTGVRIVNFAGSTSSASVSDTGIDLMYGAFYKLDLGSVSLRADWIRYTNVGKKDRTGELDIDWIGVSALIKF